MTRTYTLGGETIATRTGAGVEILDGDQNHSSTVAINAVSLAVVHRRFDPFGQSLDATTPAWPGGKGFLGKIDDADTGTVHLGAREYDSALGRFLSVDPQIDESDPQSLNGYAYADNSPVANTDPDGNSKCDVEGYCHNGKLPSDPDYNTPDTAPTGQQGGFDFGSAAGNGNLPQFEPIPDTLTPPDNDALAAELEAMRLSSFDDRSCRGNGGSGGLDIDSGCVAEVGVFTFGGITDGTGKWLKGGWRGFKGLFGAGEEEKKVAKGGAEVVRIGQRGEEAVRKKYDIGDKAEEAILGRKRIFDGYNEGVDVSEVKNVQYQAYTRQLQDYVHFAKVNHIQFVLYVRSDTRLSQKLYDLTIAPADGPPAILLREIP